MNSEANCLADWRISLKEPIYNYIQREDNIYSKSNELSATIYNKSEQL